MYDSRRLHGWNLFAGGSLVTFASILVRLQAKQEGGDCGLASFSKFMLCIFLASYAGGTALPAALQSRLRRFWFASKRNGRVVIMYWRLSTNLCCVHSRQLRGGNGFDGGSLVTSAAILVRLQAEREGGDFVLASFNKLILCMILAGCAGGTFLPAAL